MFNNLYNLDADLFDYLDNTTTSKNKEVPLKLDKGPDGCFCRSCQEFYQFAAPDNVIFDNKMTCWRCGTHLYRKYKGLPSEKVKEIDLIYNNK
jgi:hypothetical protein